MESKSEQRIQGNRWGKVVFTDYHEAALDFGRKRNALEHLYDAYHIEFYKDIDSEGKECWIVYWELPKDKEGKEK